MTNNDNEKRDGYLYTIGNSKAVLIFMEKISSLPLKPRHRILKSIGKFFDICHSLKHHKFRDYLLRLAYNETLSKLTPQVGSDAKTYLENILKTKLKVMVNEFDHLLEELKNANR